MTRKIALYAMLTALAMVVGYLERLIPVPVPIPGIKLGLANIVVLTALYAIDTKGAFVISVVRILLTGLTFTGASALMYAMAGGLLSFGGMALAKRSGAFSVVGVSVLGGALHNTGQLGVAALIVKTPGILMYLPVLLVAGTLTGLAIGALAGRVLRIVGQFRP